MVSYAPVIYICTVSYIFNSEPSSSPQSVTLMTVSATELFVSWKEVPSIDQNGIITIYEVLYQLMENYGRGSSTLNTRELSIVLSNLHKYANYSVRVRAFTIIGPGP